MFERYTETARRVIFFSRWMASQMGSRHIETVHVLLGMLLADQRLAQRFLGSPWAAEDIYKEIAQSKLVGEPLSVQMDLPLSEENKRVLAYAAEEAVQLSHKHIGSEHLLLGLIREEKSLAAAILREHDLSLKAVRKELRKTPHDDSARENFRRETVPRPPEVVEVQTRIATIRMRLREALGKRDLAAARAISDEERPELEKLRALCQQYGLADWIWTDAWIV